ncbi:MAG TPA: hypothetical protein VF209_02270 [Patescibacteria group bacterium]
MSWLRKNIWVVFIGGIVFLIIISAILRILTPPKPPEDAVSWQGIYPGYTTIQELAATFGEPEQVIPSTNGQTLLYTSEYNDRPHQVIADQEGTVRFIKEHLFYENYPTLDQLVTELGPYELELFYEEGLKGYVFLSKGVVAIASPATQRITQKWYFEPVPREVFLSSWGKELSEQAPAPESGHGAPR